MKSILMSIRPEWARKIFNGEKTIEVRKTRPLIDMPFKVLVYETKAQFVKSIRGACTTFGYGRGKVIGSFVCDDVRSYIPLGLRGYELPQEWLGDMCLTKDELDKYGGLITLYGWHITEPKLFDEPRDITEFAIFGKCADECSEYDFCARDIAEDRVACKCFKRTFLKRPPRSWCYVEGGDRE